MKKILLISLIVLLVSCKKNEPVDAAPLAAETLVDVSYSSASSQKMDIYLPAGRSTDSTKLMVLVHGGAWFGGDKSDFASFIPVIQQRLPGYAIANINYRLATTAGNHFPTQENDMKSAIDFLVQKSGDYHFSQKFVLLGASAGAHMALLQAYKYATPKILAVVDLFGPSDMTALYNFYSSNPTSQLAFQILMNGTPASNPSMYAQSSPINFVAAQSSPTLIFHGTADNLVPLSESTTLKNRLSNLGVVNQMISYNNVGHELWPAGIMSDVYDKMEQFIKANVR